MTSRTITPKTVKNLLNLVTQCPSVELTEPIALGYVLNLDDGARHGHLNRIYEALLGSGIDVFHSETHGVVEQRCDLAGRGGHRLGLSDARREPSVEGAERGVGASDGDGSKAQKCRSPAAGPARSGVPFRRLADVARAAGRRGVQDRPASREDADAADGDRGAVSPSAHHQAEPGHKIYPYLLRGIEITRPNQVWAMDITYIPMARGFVYLAVVLDWVSRRVLSWRLSITMEAALLRRGPGGRPGSSRQAGNLQHGSGRQFTGTAFTGVLIKNGIAISMDGKGAWRDNVFVERLWRSIKYEEVVCCERTVRKSERWRCFTGDEGRSLEVGLQEQASNRHELHRSRAMW